MDKRPILIAGPTASGKSSLAMALVAQHTGLIINADALQVYDGWRVMSARPSLSDITIQPHALYGHVGMKQTYSVGIWLKEISELLVTNDLLPIIVGGTGLYFRALTRGLADIPPIPESIRAKGNQMRALHGCDWFNKELQRLDTDTLLSIDTNNPARLQRAWEVLETTGKGLSYWHAQTPPPLLPIENARAIVLNWDETALNRRIDQRFDQMIDNGAVEECERAILNGFDPALPSSKALGAREIIDALNGKITLQDAVIKSKIATHQFAKRQRTWFRSNMKAWRQIKMAPESSISKILANLGS